MYYIFILLFPDSDTPEQDGKRIVAKLKNNNHNRRRQIRKKQQHHEYKRVWKHTRTHTFCNHWVLCVRFSITHAINNVNLILKLANTFQLPSLLK